MTKQMLLLAFLTAALTACSHAAPLPARFTLSVKYRGTPVFGPEAVSLMDKSIPLGGTCPDPIDGERVLQLQLSEAIDGYFHYACYTSCFLGVGEGNVGKIVPGQSVTLNCIEQELQVTLHEG